MSSGENAVREIQADLACPQCQYNLRGLRGEIVSCPECGARCDVAKLIAVRWDKPWYRAPLFNVLAIPAGWATCSLLALLVFLPVYMSIWSPPMPWPLVPGALAMIVFGWLAMMYHVARRWGGWQGVRLALLAHFVVVGLAVGIIGGMVTAISLLEPLSDLVYGPHGSRSAMLVTLITRLAILLALSGVVYVSRLGERYMAQQCIRRYLARQTAVLP